VFQRFAQQFLLRREMRVETTVREPCAGHDILQSDASDAARAEGFRCRLHNLVARSRFVVVWPGHDVPLSKHDDDHKVYPISSRHHQSNAVAGPADANLFTVLTV
jgi:hypothetical protein